MAEDPKKDEHVEELLSQLQGIFGQLSKNEEAPPPVPATPPPPAPIMPPPEASKPVVEAAPVVKPAPEPVVLDMPAPKEDPFALQPPEPLFTPPIPETSVVAPSEAVMAEPEAIPALDAGTIGCAIYYPPLREKEAKTLAQKIETMTPKFTKVAFKLKVVFILSYDRRAEWTTPVIAQVVKNNCRALFLLSDRLMDETKRRSVQAETEPQGIYFQEVPVTALEKKAFFTDVLLGMVFFFDTLKPKSGE